MKENNCKKKINLDIFIPLKWKEEDLCLRIEKSKILPDLLTVLYLNPLMSSTYPTMHIV